MEENEKRLEKVLIKKALGYNVKEYVEEYQTNDNGSLQLNKKKVASKHFSPDMTAIKILLELYGNKTYDELENMSNEELEAERDKLLSLLKEEKNKKENL